jgi:hypothetical protein
MAITAATSADRIVRRGPGKSLFESGKSASGSTSTWNQGELICLDATTHTLRRIVATADAATLVGISDNVIVAGKLVGPYSGLTATDAAEVGPDFAGPKYGVTASLTLKTGDAFNPGDKVYAADTLTSATVSITDPSDHNHVGIYVGKAITAAIAGQTGPILIGCRVPNGTGGALVV